MKKQPLPAFIRTKQASDALAWLRTALMHAKSAGSPKTVERIRKAIKSAEGAVRHAELRDYARKVETVVSPQEGSISSKDEIIFKIVDSDRNLATKGKRTK